MTANSPTWKNSRPLPASVRSEFNRLLQGTPNQTEFQRLLGKQNRPGRQEFERLLKKTKPAYPSFIDGNVRKPVPGLPKTRSNIVHGSVPGLGKVKLDAGKHIPTLMRAGNLSRRAVREAIQLVADAVIDEMTTPENPFHLDFGLGDIITSTAPAPDDWLYQPGTVEMPGFLLLKDSPTAEPPSKRGLKTQTSTYVIGVQEWFRWFGTPEVDPNPDFWDWHKTSDLPPWMAPETMAGPQFSTDGKKRKTPTYTPPRPFRNGKDQDLVIELPPGRYKGPPNIRPGKDKGRPSKGVKEKKAAKNAKTEAAWNILNGALDYTSEMGEFWMILREHSGVPSWWSHGRAMEYLMDGGISNLDAIPFATAVAQNLIIDKIIGPILGSAGGYIRKQTGLSHVQISPHV